MQKKVSGTFNIGDPSLNWHDKFLPPDPREQVERVAPNDFLDQADR